MEPEDSPPINPSPGYAFRVNKKQDAELTAYVRFVHGKFRYWRKLSRNGRTWKRAAENRVQVLADGSAVAISLNTEASELLVAAQQLFAAPHYETWTRALELSTDADLARRFRDRYSLFMVPLLFPDGVAAGHWRHTARGVELNRDRGVFSQPETGAVFATLDRLGEAGKSPAVMLDFQSTRETLFYTRLPVESPWPLDFASAWFERGRFRGGPVIFAYSLSVTARQTEFSAWRSDHC